jgi:hypothetical protein
MNRVTEFLEEPEAELPQGDYWVIYGDAGMFYVSPETACRVAARLDGWWAPRWVTFADVAGSRVRLRCSDVVAIYESTELQRTRERAFHRARRLEEKSDRRPWEDED